MFQHTWHLFMSLIGPLLTTLPADVSLDSYSSHVDVYASSVAVFFDTRIMGAYSRWFWDWLLHHFLSLRYYLPTPLPPIRFCLCTCFYTPPKSWHLLMSLIGFLLTSLPAGVSLDSSSPSVDMYALSSHLLLLLFSLIPKSCFWQSG